MNLNLTLASDLIFRHSEFERLLSRGSITFESASYNSLVCRDFGIQKKIDFPVASIESFHKKSSSNNYIYNATPCYFSLQKDYYKYEKNLEKDLFYNELQELCKQLNNNFLDSNQSFFIENNKLFFQSNNNNNVGTYFPEEINQIEERRFLPFGKDALKWHSLINEIQMYLHNAPINKIRMDKNKLPINSIWFSGGGVFPENIKSPFSKTVISNSNLINKLSLITNNFMVAEPNVDIKNFLNDIDHIYYELPNNSDEKDLFLSIISEWLNEGVIGKIIIRICIGNVCLNTNVDKFSKLKFWKKNISLDKIFNEYS